MSPPDELILLRLSGEICTKSRKTRQRFTTRLVEAVEDALLSEGLEPEIDRRWSRLFVAAPAAAAPCLQRVVGVQSISPVARRAWGDLDELVAHGAGLFTEPVRGRRFAVRAKRTGGHELPFTSLDVERALGSALLPVAAGVDLETPEVTVHVEVHATDAYFFTDVLPGPAGLPMGVEGRALALLSGGFDSAVAAWQLLRRGVALDYLFFDLGGEPHRRGVEGVLTVLAGRWSYGDWPRLHAIDLRPLLPRIRERIRPRYWQLVLKWAMYRVAEAVARELELPFLVTGESLGQVSSQTLPNLAALSAAVEVPILRPLAGANKDEIVALARAIGTHEASAAVPEYCALQPRHALTTVSARGLAAEARQLGDLELPALVAGREVREARALGVPGGRSLALEGDLPGDAVVIDLRGKEDYRRWHAPGALWLDFFEALKAHASLPAGSPYVFYCEVGFKSAHLAELLRRRGIDARHVPGGAAWLQRRGARVREPEPVA